MSFSVFNEANGITSRVARVPRAIRQVPETAGTLICLQREARFLYGHEVPSAPVIFRGRCYGDCASVKPGT